MSSILFNNFKKRFLSGNVPSADEWYFIPVNSVFKNTYDTTKMPLEQYRNVDDFMKTDSTVFSYTSPAEATEYNHYQMSLSSDNFNYKIETMSGTGLLSGCIYEKSWRKVLDDEVFSNKPMFINAENFDNFKEFYYSTISANITSITEYINSGGFYYIRSKDELTWFANRANKLNNRIIGVIGDKIEGVINGDPIGADEKYPFEGILDGNGYSLQEITLECSTTDYGLVGVLGKFGTVKNFNIYGNITLNCSKKLNLNHIKSDARDINAGVLVGRNYGKVYNINAATLTLHLNGFIPEVYSVTNKSDDYTWSDGKVRQKWSKGTENFYFLNSWCINSPGNVCPYVGYFAEGYYGEDMWASTRYFQDSHNLTATTENIKNELPLSADWALTGTTAKKFDFLDSILYSGNINGPYYQPLNAYNRVGNVFYGLGLGGQYADAKYSNTANPTQLKNEILALCQIPVYMGVDKDLNYTTCILNNTLNKNKTDPGIPPKFWPNTVTSYRDAWGGSNICYNANIIKNVYKNKINESLGDYNSTTDTSSYFPYCPSAYCQTSLRMSPMARAAYNIGCLVGANYGTISSVFTHLKITNDTNFVGFIGGIAGKQGRGQLLKVHADTNYQLNYNPVGNDKSYQVVYKQTPLLPKDKKPDYYIYSANNIVASCNADLMFSAFYDDDPTVDLDRDITDDCIIYKLKPIFIAGGLFGRYIPSDEYCFADNVSFDYIPAGCTISSCDIMMYSNYGITHSEIRGTTADISIENAFGVIAGKIDYETSNMELSSTFIQAAGIRLINSHISGYGKFGEDLKIKPYKSKVLTGKNNQLYQSYVYDGVEYEADNRKYVGVYELKYNPVNSLSLATTDRYIKYFKNYDALHPTQNEVSSYTAIIDQTTNDLLKGDDTGYLFIADLPFMTNYASGGAGASFWGNWNLSPQMSSDSVNNLGLNIPVGYNKRNIAHELITVSSCTSNISPIIVLYDDFFNTWGDEDPDSYNNLSLNVAHTKKWNKRNLYGNQEINLGLARSYETTKFKFYSDSAEGKGMIENVYCDVYQLISYTATNGSVSCMTFNSGYGINGMEVAGIQNAFDGYTFIRTETQPAYAPDKQLRNIILNPNEFGKFYEYATLSDNNNKYHNPRIFEKNRLLYKSYHLTPYNIEDPDMYYMGEPEGTPIGMNESLVYIKDMSNLIASEESFIDKSILSVHSQEYDKYFYYTYDIINSAKINYDTFQDIENNGLIGKHNVTFTANGDKLYYSLDGTHTKTHYTIGDYLTPLEIRDTLNKKGNFTTTSVSSDQDFAGLLVVDSSGRNIMFMENSNNVPLTGNNVSFKIDTESDNDMMNILEVK